MIKFCFKFTLSFVISFSLLCLPVKKKPLFSILYGYFGQQVLHTIDELVDKGQQVVVPKLVKIIKSDPSTTKRNLPAHYAKSHYFSKKHFTTEEKQLMLKVLLEHEKPEQ